MANMQIVPAYKNVEAQLVEMMVPLYSYGCEKKVKKTLSHLKGIYSVNVDYNEQKVTVWGICNKHDMLKTMKGKRKEARFWNPDDTTELEQEPNGSSLSSPPLVKLSKPSLALARARSLGWKTMKKIFARSYSF
ncbi:heavy metal-associated isoprenylated plant protein 28 [Carica papaya]|uniref:heavy metal-associated isoprenylated plant protein 28 n=1 Tax=Carica papaya TaxID=3649 RepID=UPI000B8CB032|nr:heavy metal-associated isoprenylated plant protein 28 [Carica papaya]